MRVRNALELLEAAGRPLLAQGDALVDDVEEDRILGRILASDRVERQVSRSRRMTPVLIGVVVVAAAALAATLELGHSRQATPRTSGHHRLALSGSKIKLAGYHFKTPAGFKPSDTSCGPRASEGQPTTVLNRFAAAASADGGCVEGFIFISSNGAPEPVQEGAESVTVGTYQGYFVPQNSLGQSALFVQLPTLDNGVVQYLVLNAQGLTEDQLLAVGVSGLPSGSASSNRVIR